MAGIVAYGAYIPYHRLKRSEIAAVLGEGGGKGTRSVASYDEDATSMAVEASRAALAGLPAEARPQRVFLATASPPYLDKTNATVVHAALDLGAGRRHGRVGAFRRGCRAGRRRRRRPHPGGALRRRG